MPRGMELGPVGLLVWCGTLLGMGFPLSKMSVQAGVSPLFWALWISVGTCIVLLPFAALRGCLKLPRGQMLRYVVITGVLSSAGVNVLIMGLVTKLGAGHVAMMFAISPVATLALSALFRLKTPSWLGMWGLGFGLMGALMVAFARGGFAGSLYWALAGLSIPAVLAVGNVYRTLDWPEGVHPLALSFWSQIVAIVVLAAIVPLVSAPINWEVMGDLTWIALAQTAAAALTIPAYFRLQRVGGPVMLSQIGYVAAAVGLCVGVVVLGERYGVISWIGTAVTALGIALTILSQQTVQIRLPLPLGRRTRARFTNGSC